MARTFGGTLDAVVADTRGNTLPGVTVHAWDAATGGTALGTTVSGVDGSFELTLDTTAPGVYVSAGTTGPRRYVPAREAVPDLVTSLANKTNNATTAALSERVDTTETRVGTVEDEVAGRLSVAALGASFDARTDELFLPPHAFVATTGAPVRELAATRWDAWTMPDSTTASMGVAASVLLPDHWTRFAVDLLFAAKGPETGNVRATIVTGIVNPGDALTNLTVNGSTTVTAAAQDIVFVAANVATNVAYTAGKLMLVRAMRASNDPADTFPGALSFLGATLRRTA